MHYSSSAQWSRHLKLKSRRTFERHTVHERMPGSQKHGAQSEGEQGFSNHYETSDSVDGTQSAHGHESMISPEIGQDAETQLLKCHRGTRFCGSFLSCTVVPDPAASSCAQTRSFWLMIWSLERCAFCPNCVDLCSRVLSGFCNRPCHARQPQMVQRSEGCLH